MKNIAIDLTPLTVGVTKGGLARSLECLVPELLQMGNERYYIFKRRNVATSIPNSGNCKIVNIDFVNFITWQQFYLPFYIYRYNINIFFGTLEILPFLKPVNTKFVTYLFEDPFCRYKVALEKDASGFYQSLSRVYNKVLLKRSFRRTDFIICASGVTYEEIVKRYSLSGRIEVLEPGINDIFKKTPDKEFVGNTLSKYNIKARYVFSLSSDDPRNNTERVIISFSELKKKIGYEGNLILGGRISEHTRNKFAEIAEKSDCSDSVKIIGYIDDINEVACLYHGCDLYIDLPIFEGFGLQVVEAAAIGIPIVCSDIAPLNENIKDSALFVEPTDIKEIAASMEKILNDEQLKNRLTDKYREIRERFSWNKVAVRLNEYFSR